MQKLSGDRAKLVSGSSLQADTLAGKCLRISVDIERVRSKQEAHHGKTEARSKDRFRTRPISP